MCAYFEAETPRGTSYRVINLGSWQEIQTVRSDFLILHMRKLEPRLDEGLGWKGLTSWGKYLWLYLASPKMTYKFWLVAGKMKFTLGKNKI